MDIATFAVDLKRTILELIESDDTLLFFEPSLTTLVSISSAMKAKEVCAYVESLLLHF